MIKYYGLAAVIIGLSGCFSTADRSLTNDGPEQSVDAEKPNAARLPDTIPFRLTEYNNLIVRAVLNGVDTLDLMFHTAVNSVGLTTEATERVTSIRATGKSNVKSWGGESNATYSDGNLMRIGREERDSLRVWASERSGRYSDGKFGPNFFGGQIIEIDFDQSRLIIHPELPGLPAGFEKWELETDRGSYFARGSCIVSGDTLPHHFMIHSGYGGTLLLDEEFSSRYQLAAKLTITDEKVLRDSYGNTLTTNKSTLPAFTLPGASFVDLPMAFFEGSIGDRRSSVLGGALLKRFHLYLDPREPALYARPNGLMSLAFDEP